MQNEENGRAKDGSIQNSKLKMRNGKGIQELEVRSLEGGCGEVKNGENDVLGRM